MNLGCVPENNGLTEKLSEDYRVFLNGRECPVYTARVSAIPFAKIWFDKRDIKYTEISSMVRFDGEGEAEVRVLSLKKKGFSVVRPLGRGVRCYETPEGYVFRLTQPGQYTFEVGDDRGALCLFFDPPQTKPARENCTYYFGAGIHCPGLIRLQSGDRVYIDRDAVVYGSLFGEDVRDVTITGTRVLDGSFENRVFEGCYEPYTKSLIKLYECENVVIDGPVLRDAPIWVVNLFGCKHIDICNIKAIGHWRPNTDGVDIVNSSYVMVRDSFLRTFDDTVTLKGIDRYQHLNVEHISVQNCVLWCGWGRTLEIGLETACRCVRNVEFKNCDLIHNSAVCMDIQNGDYAEVYDVLYEDIRAEYQPYTLEEQLMRAPEQEYTGKKGAVPSLIEMNNFRFREHYKGFPKNDTVYENSFTVHDITFRNIKIFRDDGVKLPALRIGSEMENVLFSDILVDGLYENGRKVKESELEIVLKRTNGFRIL